jgi:hypothetical protein
VGEVAVHGQQLEPGDQVRCDRGELHPGGVDRPFTGRQTAQAGVFGCLDSVLDAGVGAVPGLQKPKLSDAGVGCERLIPITIVGLEQRQLGLGCGCSRRTITRMPSGQPDSSSSPVASATSACSRTSPSAVTAGLHTVAGSRATALVTAALLAAKPTEYSTRRPRTLSRLVSQSSS